MKIIYLVEETGVFGGVRIICEHLNRLTLRGHDCILLRLNSNAPPLVWLPTFFEQGIYRPAQRYSCDVVVATSLGSWETVATAGNFGSAKRMVLVQMMEHLFVKDEPTAEHERLYRLPLHPIVISKWLAEALAEYNPLPSALVPNGVDQYLFQPQPSLIERGDHPRLLIEGYSHSNAKDPDEMAYMAVRFARRCGWQGEVWGFSQFAPRWEYDRYWVNPPQTLISQIYSSCDILLKSTRYEGRPGPDIEAMACGCVVNRAILKGDDDLRPEDNCLCVRYGDQEGFNTNLLRLLASADLRARLRANGLAYVRATKNWDRDCIPLLEMALTQGM